MRRFVEAAISAAALVVLTPLLAVTALAIVLDSGFPAFFRQMRVGRDGRLFRLWKLRTMREETGLPLTTAADRRVTRVGRWLRRTKLDELPQLLNVLSGSMALVGPRPEVPEFVDLTDAVWQRILAVRPGLFDAATLAWLDEERLLAAATDPAGEYAQAILPQKLAMSMAYLERQNVWTDFVLLIRIMRSVRLGL